MQELEIDPLASKEREKAESEAHEWQLLREAVRATKTGQRLGDEWVDKEIAHNKLIANIDHLREHAGFNSRNEFVFYLITNVFATLERESEQGES